MARCWKSCARGCYHSRHRFCRMCLLKRRALFTSPKESYQNRNDGEHEALAFKCLSEMQVQFGLEDEGPDADVDAAADSLDAFESSDDPIKLAGAMRARP